MTKNDKNSNNQKTKSQKQEHSAGQILLQIE